MNDSLGQTENKNKQMHMHKHVNSDSTAIISGLWSGRTGTWVLGSTVRTAYALEHSLDEMHNQ